MQRIGSAIGVLPKNENGGDKAAADLPAGGRRRMPRLEIGVDDDGNGSRAGEGSRPSGEASRLGGSRAGGGSRVGKGGVTPPAAAPWPPPESRKPIDPWSTPSPPSAKSPWGPGTSPPPPKLSNSDNTLKEARKALASDSSVGGGSRAGPGQQQRRRATDTAGFPPSPNNQPSILSQARHPRWRPSEGLLGEELDGQAAAGGSGGGGPPRRGPKPPGRSASAITAGNRLKYPPGPGSTFNSEWGSQIGNRGARVSEGGSVRNLNRTRTSILI